MALPWLSFSVKHNGHMCCRIHSGLVVTGAVLVVALIGCAGPPHSAPAASSGATSKSGPIWKGPDPIYPLRRCSITGKVQWCSASSLELTVGLFQSSSQKAPGTRCWTTPYWQSCRSGHSAPTALAQAGSPSPFVLRTSKTMLNLPASVDAPIGRLNHIVHPWRRATQKRKLTIRVNLLNTSACFLSSDLKGDMTL